MSALHFRSLTQFLNQREDGTPKTIKWRIHIHIELHKDNASKLTSQFAEYWPIHCGMNEMAASTTIIRDILLKSSIFRKYFELLTDTKALVAVASSYSLY